MASACLLNHFGGAVNADDKGACGCDSRGEMAGAATDVQNALARLGVKQLHKSCRHLPDKGMLFIIEARIPLRTWNQVYFPPISRTAPEAVSSSSLPFFPKRTCA